MASFPGSAALLFDRRVPWDEATHHTANNECFRGLGTRMVILLVFKLYNVVFLAAGSDYKDNSLNLMPFFSTSCYTGYGDDHKASIIMPWSICVYTL